MAETKTRSDFTVDYVQHTGDDLAIARAAWVSTGDDGRDAPPEKVRGVLNFLMRNRHGTPFEHGSLTLRVEAPIFLWREWHRHRIGWSYNEESGRYKQLSPVFYVPGEARRVHCIKPADFKPSKPGFRGFTAEADSEFSIDNSELAACCQRAYDLYQLRLDAGYDNGLARICLPVSIYSACYVTCNPRSLMAFLELRTDDESAGRRSHPLWEMHQVASQVEQHFREHWPLTHALWEGNGRMAP